MISVKEITKNFHLTRALNKVSFEIKKGEIVGLLGLNGAGKTTTLRIITGFLQPTSGEVYIKGKLMDENSFDLKKNIGYLPESAPIYPDMLVYDYLCYLSDIHKIAPNKKLARIKQLASICGLNEVMHKAVSELSKGYRQRVGLAHAMTNDPEILILDEPTAGLDPNQRMGIRDLIKHLGKQKTVILSSHILPEVEATCDRIIIINQGIIVADSTTEQLKAASGTEYIFTLTLAEAKFAEAKETLSGVKTVKKISKISERAGELKIQITSDTDIRDALYKKIKRTSWIMLNFQQETKSLENIFHELTRSNA